jgi:pimeloyl-ACP methyl ester carboxylesterase
MVYERRGQGPTVVLLHGWCLSHALWLYEEDLLAADHDVITPDLPGFGRSDGMPGPHDMASYSRAVRGVLDDLDITQAVLVGFAFGAAVAMQVAADNPSRLAGAVLIGVPSASRFPAQAMARSIRRDWPDFAHRSASVLCGPRHSEATRRWLEEMYRSTPLISALQGADLLGTFEPAPLARQLRIPVCYVHGVDDTVIPASVALDCAAASTIENRVELIEDCGHLVVLDQRNVLHSVIQSFVEQVHATTHPQTSEAGP